MIDKSIVKLPSIHERRGTNNSRQGMIKDGKMFHSKNNSVKNRHEDAGSLGKYH